MLKGAGTTLSPLSAYCMEYMDITLMYDLDTKEQKYVIILRDENADELFAISLSLENFRDLIARGGELDEGL